MTILMQVSLKYGQNHMLRSSLSFCLSFLFLTALVACGFKREEFWYKSASDAKFVQVDRIGLPYVYELFSDDEEQSVLEQLALGDPSSDEEKFAPLLTAEVNELRVKLAAVDGIPALSANAKSPSEVADALTPNVLSVDLSKDLTSTKFNGFSLQNDDAFDAMLILMTGRLKIGDGLEEKESTAYKKSFPYLSRQNY